MRLGRRPSCSARSSRRPIRPPRPRSAQRLGLPRRLLALDRRREPRQRRNRARRLQVRGGGRGDRRLLARRGGRDASCSASSAGSRSGSRSATSSASSVRALDNPPVEITVSLLTRLLRLPARAGGRRLGRARGGHGRHLHGLAHPRADDRADPTPGTGGLGDGLPRPERAAVRTAGAAAAADRRLAVRLLDRNADRIRARS